MKKLIILGLGIVLLFGFSDCARFARDANGSKEESSDSNLEAIKKQLEEYAEIAHEKLAEAGNKIKETVNKEKLDEMIGKAKDAIARLAHGSSSEAPTTE